VRRSFRYGEGGSEYAAIAAANPPRGPVGRAFYAAGGAVVSLFARIDQFLEERRIFSPLLPAGIPKWAGAGLQAAGVLANKPTPVCKPAPVCKRGAYLQTGVGLLANGLGLFANGVGVVCERGRGLGGAPRARVDWPPTVDVGCRGAGGCRRLPGGPAARRAPKPPNAAPRP
jgi:hypothetical protein